MNQRVELTHQQSSQHLHCRTGCS